MSMKRALLILCLSSDFPRGHCIYGLQCCHTGHHCDGQHKGLCVVGPQGLYFLVCETKVVLELLPLTVQRARTQYFIPMSIFFLG